MNTDVMKRLFKKKEERKHQLLLQKWQQAIIQPTWKGEMTVYRHPVERQLTMDLKLVGRSHPSTGVHQIITKLQGEWKDDEDASFHFIKES